MTWAPNVENASEVVKAAVADIEADERQLIANSGEMFKADGGAVYGFDLLANAAINRALALSSGFRTLILERNLVCAGPLVRLQLDTSLRLYAGFIVEKPHDFAIKVFAGKHIRRLKDKDGNSMTDRYLVEKLAKQYPWIESVYERASDYVHLSGTHILSSVELIDKQSDVIGLKASFLDKPLSDDIYIDAINAFRQCTRIVADHIEGWIWTKNNPEKIASLREMRERESRGI